jgi:hypothetical protein
MLLLVYNSLYAKNLLGIYNKVLDITSKLAYNINSNGELTMIETAIFLFCLLGCGLTCHELGKQEGIETTIETLIDKGLLQTANEE